MPTLLCLLINPLGIVFSHYYFVFRNIYIGLYITTIINHESNTDIIAINIVQSIVVKNQKWFYLYNIIIIQVYL